MLKKQQQNQKLNQKNEIKHTSITIKRTTHQALKLMQKTGKPFNKYGYPTMSSCIDFLVEEFLIPDLSKKEKENIGKN